MSWMQRPWLPYALALVAACSSSRRPGDLDRDRDGAIDERDESSKPKRDAGVKTDASRSDADASKTKPPRAGNGSDVNGAAGMADPIDATDACVPDASCEPDPIDDCGSLTVARIQAPADPHLLLIFDRSGSMQDLWGDLTRWEAAGNAVQSALEPIADRLTVGALFFPTPAQDGECIDPTDVACMYVPGLGCNVGSLAADPQIAFEPGDEFMTTFTGSDDVRPYGPVVAGLTPLREALAQAQTDLAAMPPAGPTAIAIITDGDPNCAWDEVVAEDIVADWHDSGIAVSFFAIAAEGFDTSTLDLLASRADTELQKPTNLADLERSLGDTFNAATHRGLPCTIPVENDGLTNDHLHVVVGRPDFSYEAPAELGWTFDASSRVVTLTGELCAAAQHGDFDSIALHIGCLDLPTLEL